MELSFGFLIRPIIFNYIELSIIWNSGKRMIDINNKGCHQLLLFIIVYNIYIYIIIEKAIIIYILYYITNMLLLKYLLQ